MYGMAGRKNKYETHIEPYLDLIKSMRIDGHTEKQIFDRLGVSHTTWEKYKNERVELLEALKYSKEGLVAKLEQTLFQKALEGNMTAVIFALKNLAPSKWGERVDVNANLKSNEFIEALSRFGNKI